MVKAIIFDCFGVLVGKGFDYTYRLAGGDPRQDRAFVEDMLGQANMGHITDEAFRAAMSQKLGISRDKWRQVTRTAEQPDAELLGYIKQLRPRYKTAVLSNANRGVVERKIGAEQLQACFDTIIVSAEIGLVKPDPRIYQRAAEELGVDLSECVFVDDSPAFVASAAELGMAPILYRDFPQLSADLEKLLA